MFDNSCRPTRPPLSYAPPSFRSTVYSHLPSTAPPYPPFTAPPPHQPHSPTTPKLRGPVEFVGDLDVRKIVFRANGSKVEVRRIDAGRQLLFNLCEDVDSPVEVKFGLEVPFNDSTDGSRRNLAVNVTDRRVIAVFSSIDEAVVTSAIANSEAWFNTPNMSEAEVRERCKYR